MDRAIGEDERQDQIVGDAAARRLGNSAGNPSGSRRRPSGAARRRRWRTPGDRAVAEPGIVEQVVRRFHHRDPAALAPDETASHHLRVQGAHEHLGLPQADPGGRSRSHSASSTCCGSAADRAPSISHSAIALSSPAAIVRPPAAVSAIDGIVPAGTSGRETRPEHRRMGLSPASAGC